MILDFSLSLLNFDEFTDVCKRQAGEKIVSHELQFTVQSVWLNIKLTIVSRKNRSYVFLMEWGIDIKFIIISRQYRSHVFLMEWGLNPSLLSEKIVFF